MHTAATDGTSGSQLGARAFWQSDAILPGVSLPSSVVKSIIRTASVRASILESFLMDLVPSDATRSVTFFTFDQFAFGNYGLAAAASYLLFLAIVLLSCALIANLLLLPAVERRLAGEHDHRRPRARGGRRFAPYALSLP